jgi:hypothetical protein
MKTATRKQPKTAGQGTCRVEHRDYGSFLLMNVAGKQEAYAMHRIGSDLGLGLLLCKDGETVHEVHVGGQGESSCSCPGHEFGWNCKHVRAVKALAAAGKLGSIPG